jgi:hypothetical protein
MEGEEGSRMFQLWNGKRMETLGWSHKATSLIECQLNDKSMELHAINHEIQIFQDTFLAFDSCHLPLSPLPQFPLKFNLTMCVCVVSTLEAHLWWIIKPKTILLDCLCPTVIYFFLHLLSFHSIHLQQSLYSWVWELFCYCLHVMREGN